MRSIYYISYLVLILLGVSCGTPKILNTQIFEPTSNIPEVIKQSDSLYSAGDNFLIQNQNGLWEMYVSGDAYERGHIIGGLSKDLALKQEKIFFSKVEEIVPSKSKQKLLRGVLKYYNRNLEEHIPEEYRTEIHGLTTHGASDDYAFLGTKYFRGLYLHSAHDIGHALQDLALVGCSSMAVWGDKTIDGDLLIGRNFDFYAGDEFAEDKIIAFIRPDKGVPFMTVTWGGMIGAVSGMNLEGLTVTINAGKSKIPFTAKTPIAILTREILQYATTIDEAIAIAKSREVFVSESIMIGSANDKKAVLIEVSPKNFGIYDIANSSQLICSNHFQSEAYDSDKRNTKHKNESHSMYRYQRMQELLFTNNKMNPDKMVSILRNTKGLDNKSIGYGNEKALNQLLAHHGIVFSPEKKKVWVSTNPYQLGEFVAYDLETVFNLERKGFDYLNDSESLIQADQFMHTAAYQDYERYRILDRELDKKLNSGNRLTDQWITDYQNANPEFWKVYYRIGQYYYNHGFYDSAQKEFEKAQSKEVTTVPAQESITDYLTKINKKIK